MIQVNHSLVLVFCAVTPISHLLLFHLQCIKFIRIAFQLSKLLSRSRIYMEKRSHTLTALFSKTTGISNTKRPLAGQQGNTTQGRHIVVFHHSFKINILQKPAHHPFQIFFNNEKKLYGSCCKKKREDRRLLSQRQAAGSSQSQKYDHNIMAKKKKAITDITALDVSMVINGAKWVLCWEHCGEITGPLRGLWFQYMITGLFWDYLQFLYRHARNFNNVSSIWDNIAVLKFVFPPLDIQQNHRLKLQQDMEKKHYCSKMKKITGTFKLFWNFNFKGKTNSSISNQHVICLIFSLWFLVMRFWEIMSFN